MTSVSQFDFIVQMQKQRLARRRYAQARWRRGGKALHKQFCTEQKPTRRFGALVQYFWQAHIHYRTGAGTHVDYPGLPSIYGAKSDAVEGCSRLLPLWAVYASATHENNVQQDMQHHINRVLLAGTDPGSVEYWGEVKHKDTLICESADLALALWLNKSGGWQVLSQAQQGQILAWFKQVPNKRTADNNWHLFAVLVDLIIADLDPDHVPQTRVRYERVKSFYLGQGCFKDGPDGAVDLYNAWGFHYALFWINEICPDWDPDFIPQATTDYSAWFQYLFTAQGFPLYGRSLCYRMAVPVPVLATALYSPQTVAPGAALSMLTTCWQYFVHNGAVEYGRPTQGVFDDAQQWLDPYSGPASAFWSLRSVVMFYYLNRQLDWDSVEPLPLPSETQNKTLFIEAAGIKVSADKCSGITTLELLDNQCGFNEISLSQQTIKEKLRQLIYGIGQRPNNNLQRLGVRRFDSRLEYYR